MRIKISLIVLIVLVVVVFSSCCEKKVYCNYGTIDFAFTGFPRNEVRNFTLRRYVKGDQWGKVIDSAQYIYYGDAQITVRPDTLPFADYRTVGDLPAITQGNDWAIYLPSNGMVYFITTIFDDNNVSQLVRCNDKETSCTRAITNFSLNSAWQNGNFVYIQK